MSTVLSKWDKITDHGHKMIVPPSRRPPSSVVSDLETHRPSNLTIKQSESLTQADIQQTSEIPNGYCGRDIDIGVDT